MLKDAYKKGANAAYEKLGVRAKKDSDESSTLDTVKKVAPWLLAAGTGLGAYKYLRNANMSPHPELARLQQQAKDKTFEVATTRPLGRKIRSALFGARDIPHVPPTPQIGTTSTPSVGERPGAAILHHTGGSPSRVTGDVNINAGVLPDAMDDKYLFSRLMGPSGTSGGLAPGMPGAIPDTQLLRDVLQQHKGDLEAVKRQFPGGYVIKPRTGSMSKAESLLTHETPHEDPRLRRALENPAAHIIQEKMPIQREFRVHMVNNVPVTATHRQIPNENVRQFWDNHMGGGGGAFVPVMGKTRKDLQEFARNATRHLGVNPVGKNVLGDAENLHHALDIAQLPDGSFKVIESNPTPGTFMNPITARKVQRAITGRWDPGTATLGGLAAGSAALGGAKALMGPDDDQTTPQRRKRSS